MKKKGMKKKYNSNRLIYFLVTLGILIAIAVGVYALSAGVKPNPGHMATDIAPPAECTAGQFLQFTGTNWTCGGSSVSGGLYGFCTMIYTWNTDNYQALSNPSVGLRSSACVGDTIAPMTCPGYCTCPAGYSRISLNYGVGQLGTKSGGYIRTYFAFSCAKQ